MDWLIDAEGPLTATLPDRSFNVKVINHSLGAVWDGPGDGQSRYGNVARRSLLAAVDYATANGVIWVNASGNAGVGTFFKRDPVFHPTDNYLQFGQFGLSYGCNLVKLVAGADYFFQLRSDGDWSRADTNLAIALDGPLHVPQDERLLFFSTDMQSGDVGHVPFDTLSVSGLPGGQYCLMVTKDPNDSDPEWVQLQVDRPDNVELRHKTDTGSLNNPSESANDGMLSVGAASNTVPPVVQPFSAKGPAPEPYPPDRVALDFVGGVFDGLLGTSFSSPRVAGLAALVVGALGDRPYYDTPSEVTRYLRGVLDCPLCSPNTTSGHGFLALPPLSPPNNLRLEQISCAPTGNLRVSFDPPDEEISLHRGKLFIGDVRVVNNPDLDVAVNLPRTSVGGRTVRVLEGETYQANVKTCLGGLGSGDDICGPEAASAEFLFLNEICKPRSVRAVAGDGIVTLRWNAENDAEHYDVEREGAANPETTSEQHWVFDGLTNGTTYRFRVRSKGSLGTSDWSSWYGATPMASTRDRLSSLGDIVDASDGDLFKRNDVTLAWFPRHDAARYEVRIWDGTTSKWRILPVQPKGWGERYEVVFEYGFQEVKAGIRGLIPGTGYAFQVRGVNGDKRSPLSKRITVVTSGSRPSDAPSLAVIPPPKMPPSELEAAVNGTSVGLSWELGTNPNYVRQEVWRREVGVTPLDWTEIAVGLNDTSYTDTGLVGGKQYVYRIRAEKANDKGGESNAVTVTIK